SFDKRLREVYVGDLEGKAYDEDLINRRNQGEDLPYPNGENWTDLKLRVADFYKDMQKIKRKVLIVSHGDTLTALEAYLENGDYLKSIKRIVAKGRYIKKGESRELNHRLMDLHRPYVDEMKFLCACGGEMIRDKSVLDCWFDSGSMPFAQQHYPFENKELIDQGRQYPADFICEAVDQTRGWFYTLHAVATALGRGPSFKNVICLGHINDKYGKKMSKSKGNIINPWDVIGLYGVDAVRLHMYTINAPGEGKNYDLDDVRDVFRKNIMILWNVYSFYAMYKKNANDANPEYSGRITRIANNANILDKWIVARLNQLIKKMAEELEKYHVYEAAREIPLFINDLSTWYLRRSRERFKSEDKKDEEAALSTLGFVLAELAKVMAPFMPFISEQLWQKVTGYNFADENKSVHLEQWPAVAPSFAKATAGEKASAGKPAGLKIKKEELKIMEEMAMARKIVELGLAKRDEAGIKVRQPLRELRIKNYELRMEYAGLIKAELNVKAITFKKGQGEISVELDTEISEELKLEGMKRELVRAINNMRKEAGLTIGDRIEIKWNGTGSVTETIKVFEKEIMKETLADIILSTNKEEGKAVMINGEKVILEIRKKI
ncbi:MAG: class I tRNA ligase family protein, partial [Planctomycetes bacterium]|nr:class I tRNA ligase family protein [Planctomycetota bacterium]